MPNLPETPTLTDPNRTITTRFAARFHLPFCDGPEAEELRAQIDALPK